MQVRLSQQAIDEGILRVWLRRIPIEGGMLVAFRSDGDNSEPVATAALYGRGHGSNAMERTMLLFHLAPQSDRTLREGDMLTIKIEGQTDSEYADIDLDVLEVE